jgi:hypothetical protein
MTDSAPLENPILVRSRHQSLPLSYAEEALWHAHQRKGTKGTNAYNVSVAFRLKAPNVQALQRAVIELVGRHEILRTSFRHTASGLIRHIHRPDIFQVKLEDLRSSSADVNMRMTAQAEMPFELDAGPLFRCGIYQENDVDHYLHLTIHHIISDARSSWILSRELFALYHHFDHGAEDDLGVQVLQYADYAVWQRKLLTASRLDVLLEYWRQHLTNSPPCINLPTDSSRSMSSGLEAEISFTLPSTVRHAIAELGRRARTTTFVVLLTAFKLLLHKVSSDARIVVGVLIENRTRPELETMVGLFLNFLAIQTDFSARDCFGRVLRLVHAAMIAARKHSDMPIISLTNALGLDLKSSHTPLFQVMFNFRNAALTRNWKVSHHGGGAGSNIDSSELECEPMFVQTRLTANHDLVMNVNDGEALEFCLLYDAALFSPARMKEFAGQFISLVQQVTLDPDSEYEAYNVDQPLSETIIESLRQ